MTFVTFTAFTLAALLAEFPYAQETVRGLKTVLVEAVDSSVTRRFPSVLVPADVSTLSFEIGGKLNAVSLDVGQVVGAGDVLATLDETTLQLELQREEAAVEQAQAEFNNAADLLARQEQLLQRGSVTRVSVEDIRTQAVTAAAQLEQARTALSRAQENLTKTQLVAPFDGIINTVEVQSFTNVAGGSPVATLYRSDGFEVKFTVSFDIVTMLALGKQASVRLAARPNTVLAGTVTEIGARADRVSSFPVVVTIVDAPADVRAGMSVEVELDFSLIGTPGYLIPLSALIDEFHTETRESPLDPVPAEVYLYDPASSTVRRHAIMIIGVRQNQLLVADGLEPGQRVASAGVPFLRDGMEVRLLVAE